MAESTFITLSPWAIDIRGDVYGDLTAIGPVRSSEQGVYWLCQCACGGQTYASARSLRRGNVRSCGCLARRLSIQRATTHGMSRTAEYRAWRNLVTRCCNPNSDRFKNYGGRGITVCERWRLSFTTFIADMGLSPSRAHSIERVDNNKGYEPSNCCWATARAQANNRRNTRTVHYRGEDKALAEWMRVLNLPGRHSLYLYRLRSGWEPHAAFTTPSRKVTPEQLNQTQKETRAL